MRTKKLWEIETQLYIPRLSEVEQTLKPAFELSDKLPIAPFEKPLAEDELVAFHLALFGKGGLIVYDQLMDNVGFLWNEGRMVGVSGLVRFGFEYWAAVNFGLKIMTDLERDGDLAKAREKTARLTFSAKTPVALPWGGVTQNKAYSVQKFIEDLELQESRNREFYDFLSEASHPNFLQNNYFVMASRRYDNFSNDAFKKHAHEILDRTVEAVEISSKGLAKDAITLFEKVLTRFDAK